MICNMAMGCIPKQRALAILKTMPTSNLKECYNGCFEGNKSIYNEKLLVEAAAEGDLEILTKLLSGGVSVDAVEYNKVLFYALQTYATPLFFAALNGSVDCVKLLLKHGACVNARDRSGATALHVAAERGHYSCLVALLEAEADCTVATKCSSSKNAVRLPYNGRTTALHLASARNHAKCVKELILYGADYNAVDEFGHTSLYLAAQLGYADCVMIHLKNAVGRDILSLPSLITKDTPLHYVVRHQMVDCVRELLKLGSDPNHKNHSGSTPLHIAVNVPEGDEFNMQILKMLVLDGYNADINVTDNGGHTPLHFACFRLAELAHQQPEVAKFLMSYGANACIKNARGRSLLEHELQSIASDYSTLRQAVRCLPTLPHLNTMRMGDKAFAYANGFQDFVRYYPQAPNEGHPVAVGEVVSPELNAYLLANENNAPFNGGFGRPRHAILGRHLSSMNNVASHAPSATQMGVFTLQDALNLLQSNLQANRDQGGQSSACLEKLSWYEEMASNPRTLQHFCRLSIRTGLTPKNLKHVGELPLPSSFHSYLLMEDED